MNINNIIYHFGIFKKTAIFLISAAACLLIGSCTKTTTTTGGSGTNSGANNNVNGNTTILPEVDSTVYSLSQTTNYNVTMYALNASTGTIKWSWTHPTTYFSTLSPAPIGINGAYIYVSIGSILYAIDTTSKSIAWTVNNSNAEVFGSPVTDNGKLFICSNAGQTGSVYAINPLNGNIIWQIRLPANEGNNNLLPVYSHGNIYLSTISGLLALHEADGSEAFYQPLSLGFWILPPLIYNNSIYTLKTNNSGSPTLLAMDLNSGAIKWTYTAPGGSINVGIPDFAVGSTIYTNNFSYLLGIDTVSKSYTSNLYLGAGSNFAVNGNNTYGSGLIASKQYVEFTSYDLKENIVNWVAPLISSSNSSQNPTISKGTIYVNAEGYTNGINLGLYNSYQQLFAVDSATGSIKWAFAPPGPLGASYFVSDAVVITNKGNVRYSFESVK
jgi:outer membrane protein assembly factor BamB